MKKHKILLLILLVLSLSACDAFGPRTFNADGSEASPFSFEYPLGWEVLYTEQETWAVQEGSEIEFGDDGDSTVFSTDTVGVGFQIFTPELINEQFGTTEITPLEMLQQYEQEINEFRQAYENRDSEESSESTGLLQEPIQTLSNVIESPASYHICGKDVVGMKTQQHMPPLVIEAPFYENWLFFTVIGDQLIEIIGYHDMDNEERFEEIFESTVCSLEVHESE